MNKETTNKSAALRVLFPYVEAGMGHIAPMKAIAAKFKEKYGDYVCCVETNFYKDGNDENMLKFEEKMCKSVIDSNKHGIIGNLITTSMYVFGARISTEFTTLHLQKGAAEASIKRMEELSPDLVVSTHYSTNYFARQCANKPLTALYCPDPITYPMYEYDSDLTLVSTQDGYNKALRKRKRFNESNLRKVTMLVRDEAYDVTRSKVDLRSELGLDPDKFTVLLAEGGYGIGKMTDICRLVLKEDLPVNLVPVCGKNELLLKQMQSWQSKGQCAFHPVGFTDRMLDYMACSDLFCGKSGANVLAEATFFGVPQIITKYASQVEKLNGEYYCKSAKTALKIFNERKAVKKIKELMTYNEQYQKLKTAAEAQKDNFGAEQAARQIYELLRTKFTDLPSADEIGAVS